ncbi:sugar ABC transporter permease [Streptomyces sp. NBS 14/10]|uniref:carbohydrate ABC transporter permease n=1 Tax=Streptomyces sp. NBS 14/10 TaxID=1945643 RepID=UPI000B7EF835|nr:sugar ABC transporter permease [Streptomyces sp. NBS 14/10]KAK1183982.1 sugar ABC transporter permease [Streptomyces sp. NBS 14/10]
MTVTETRPGPEATTASAPGHHPRRRAWRSRLTRFDLRYTPYVFIAPFFVIFGVFAVWPLLYTGWISFHKWAIIEGDQGWLGLHNYQTLFADEYFWNALLNTALLLVLGTGVQLAVALWLAGVLNRKLGASAVWRAGVVLPHIVSVVAVSLVFAQLYGFHTGIVNDVLSLVGIDRVDWQASRWTAIPAVATIIIWRWAGYYALIFLAAMQGIPRELNEAAMLDGASRRRIFWSITVPSIRPTIIFSVVMSTIGAMQTFTEPQLFDIQGTEGTGGSDRQFQTLMMYLYEKGFREFNAGYAATLAWVMFLLIAIVSGINYALSRRIASKD